MRHIPSKIMALVIAGIVAYWFTFIGAVLLALVVGYVNVVGALVLLWFTLVFVIARGPHSPSIESSFASPVPPGSPHLDHKALEESMWPDMHAGD
jgi:hypothetical protein